MKKHMLTVVVFITLGMLSCTDENSVKENVEVEKITDVIDAVIDSNVVLIDSTSNDSIIEIEEEIIIKH